MWPSKTGITEATVPGVEGESGRRPARLAAQEGAANPLDGGATSLTAPLKANTTEKRDDDTIAVVGAGIIGLTTAIRLADAGLRPALIARDGVEQTTSANAGAIWGPFLSSIDGRVDAWSYRTLEVLREDALIPGSGVEIVEGLLAERDPAADCGWVTSFPGSRPARPDELPPGFAEGWSYTVPIVDMPVYLRHLERQASERDVPMLREEVSDTRSLPHSRIVIAAGLGARELVGDSGLEAARGQLVVVTNPGIERFFTEGGEGPDLTYILPQGDQVVLGGTAEWGLETTEPVDATSDAILARCAEIEPSLSETRVLARRVGLRPCRSSVCLERQVRDARQTLYMNYGHGGSGVSLSWGCAESVVGLVLADGMRS